MMDAYDSMLSKLEWVMGQGGEFRKTRQDW